MSTRSLLLDAQIVAYLDGLMFSSHPTLKALLAGTPPKHVRLEYVSCAAITAACGLACYRLHRMCRRTPPEKVTADREDMGGTCVRWRL